MRIRVGDAELFFDVDGAAWVPDGGRLRERPTVVLVHGGPGVDHSVFKPTFSTLTEDAQLVYLDLLGHGRSDSGRSAQWNLATWADGLRTFCDTLEIRRPILLGTSFGGFVALACAVRHSGFLGGLILSNTRAHTDLEHIGEAFARLGGPEAGARAVRFWSQPTLASLEAYLQAAALYMPADPERSARVHYRVEPLLHWVANEHPNYDLRPLLSAVDCPVLVLAGENDPVCPIEDAREMAAALPIPLVEFVEYAGVRHDLAHEVGDAYFARVREFLRGLRAS